MEQIGTVLKTDGQKATVLVMRTSACGENCAHCKGGCTPSKMTALAENHINAKTGDVVKIEADTKEVIKAEVILYFVPILCAIAGAVVASGFFKDSIVILASAVCFFVPFFIIKRFDKKIAPTPKITKIIDEKGVK